MSKPRYTVDKKLLFGLISYQRCGDISMLSVSGWVVYERFGSTRALFGLVVT